MKRPIEEPRFRLKDVCGVPSIVFTDGKHRFATPQEIALFKILDDIDPKEQDSLDRPSLMSWFIYYRLGHVKVFEPQFITKVIREFNRLSTAEVIQILQEEFVDDFTWKMLPDERRAMKKGALDTQFLFTAAKPVKKPKKKKKRPNNGMTYACATC